MSLNSKLNTLHVIWSIPLVYMSLYLDDVNQPVSLGIKELMPTFMVGDTQLSFN